MSVGTLQAELKKGLADFLVFLKVFLFFLRDKFTTGINSKIQDLVCHGKSALERWRETKMKQWDTGLKDALTQPPKNQLDLQDKV